MHANHNAPVRAATDTSTSSVEYLRALETKLSITWRKRCGSSSTRNRLLGKLHVKARIVRCVVATHSATKDPASTVVRASEKPSAWVCARTSASSERRTKRLRLRVDRFDLFARLARGFHEQLAISEDDGERPFEVVSEHRQQIVLEFARLLQRSLATPIASYSSRLRSASASSAPSSCMMRRSSRPKRSSFAATDEQERVDRCRCRPATSARVGHDVSGPIDQALHATFVADDACSDARRDARGRSRFARSLLDVARRNADDAYSVRRPNAVRTLDRRARA